MRLRWLLVYTVAASVDWHYMTLGNHCQKAGRSTSAPRSGGSRNLTDPSYFPTDPRWQWRRPFSILKVIVAAQFFSSCYFKVELLHTVTLTRRINDGSNASHELFHSKLLNA